MTSPFSRLARNTTVSLCLALLLSACSNISLWPFGKEDIRERPRTPTNASDYQCANSKRFYLRMLDNGSAAWVIFPEREVRLDKAAGSGNRYSNGIAALTLNGSEATLEDGPANVFSGCKKADK
ncbi:MAG: MliC family protein [Sterolibacterium sp.]